jgi:hypothetical protein
MNAERILDAACVISRSESNPDKAFPLKSIACSVDRVKSIRKNKDERWLTAPYRSALMISWVARGGKPVLSKNSTTIFVLSDPNPTVCILMAWVY